MTKLEVTTYTGVLVNTPPSKLGLVVVCDICGVVVIEDMQARHSAWHEILRTAAIMHGYGL